MRTSRGFAGAGERGFGNDADSRGVDLLVDDAGFDAGELEGATRSSASFRSQEEAVCRCSRDLATGRRRRASDCLARRSDPTGQRDPARQRSPQIARLTGVPCAERLSNRSAVPVREEGSEAPSNPRCSTTIWPISGTHVPPTRCEPIPRRERRRGAVLFPVYPPRGGGTHPQVAERARTAAETPEFRLHLPCETASVPQARARVRAWCNELRIAGELNAAIQLAVTEAATNAVQHSGCAISKSVAPRAARR
jgi:hypothetical protein